MDNQKLHKEINRIARQLFFLTVISLTGAISLFAQDKTPVNFGRVVTEDFNLPKSDLIDSNTNAVILADVGSITFVGNKSGWFNYVFNRKTRIKILNKKGFNQATVKIYLYHSGVGQELREEKADDITGAAYNLDNGNIIQTVLPKTDIFQTDLSKNNIEKKFTMPGVKAGSIIEYSYTIISPFVRSLPYWKFQNNDYPCLWSELDIEIPSLLSYSIQKHGYDNFFINQSKEGAKNYPVSNTVGNSSTYGQGQERMMVSVNTLSCRWVMKDVPALNISDDEKYISSPVNYIDKMEFQLYKVYSGEGGQEGYDYVKDWKNASATLLNESGFGGVLNVDFSWVKDKLAHITEGSANKLEEAKKIYYYLNDNYTCTNRNTKYASKSLVDVFNAKSGNDAEINLLLLSLLKEAQIKSDPVIINTRQNGYTTNTHSRLDQFNYVICKATINGQAYYLDASNPLLGFGKLADYCYNGYARVISESNPDSVWFFPDILKDPSSTFVFIANDDKKPGAITGSYEYTPGNFQSYELRQKIKVKGEKEFFQSARESLGSDIEIENVGIDSIALTEFPVKIHYDFTVKNTGANEAIYIKPIIGWQYNQNPFKNEKRRFPVEMLYPIDDTYTLNMEIPDGYAVDEMPKSARVALNDQDGFFEYSIQRSETNIQLRARIKLNKATFPIEDYNTLRDFFAYVVKKQNEQIVFKKKK
jgi:uncharacterized protein DUF3858/transglutaminase superfamily protein/uncharacterized protein DUF3857